MILPATQILNFHPSAKQGGGGQSSSEGPLEGETITNLLLDESKASLDKGVLQVVTV